MNTLDRFTAVSSNGNPPDVEADARWRSQEEDTIHPGELFGMIDPRLEVFGQDRNESRLVVETRQEGEIDVNRLARFTPALDREAADEAEPPPLGHADRLEVGGRADDLVHRRSFRKTRCCSIRPEVGFGARGASL